MTVVPVEEPRCRFVGNNPGRTLAMTLRRWAATAVAVLLVSLALPFGSAAAVTLNTVDQDGRVGTDVSMVLSESGNPVMSYWDGTNDDLRVAVCLDPSCSPGNVTVNVVAATGAVGWASSLVLNGLGHPVISFYDATNGDVMVAVCTDAVCTPGSVTTNVIDAAGDVGRATSMVLDELGNPVIAYYDYTQHSVKLAVCKDAFCNPGSVEVNTVDHLLDGGGFVSLALDGLGHPVIAYLNIYLDGMLNVAVCADAFCRPGTVSTTSIIDGDGYFASMVLNGSGHPVISFFKGDAFCDFDCPGGLFSDLRVAVCGDPLCSQNDVVVRSIDVEGSVGEFTSLSLDVSGNPVISYYDRTNGDLKLATCADATCSPEGIVTNVVDAAGNVGGYTSMALDGSGNPVMAYYDWTNGTLMVAVCDDPTCDPRPFCLGQAVTVDLAAGGLPTNGDDVILGTAEADVINALAGDDIVCGGGGDDKVLGGDGDDFIDLGEGDDSVWGGEGDDIIDGGTGIDRLRGGAGDDTIVGGFGRDIILGGAGKDRIYGDPGRDSLYGGEGDDVIDGGADTDLIRGQGGNDTLKAGSSGNDRLVGGDGDDVLDARDTSGSTRLIGDNGDDTFFGSEQLDRMWGGSGSDTMYGRGYNDLIRGGAGNDFIYGESGRDTLDGGAGDDLLHGGDGNSDKLVGLDGYDTCNGGTGVADFAHSTCEMVLGIP